MSRINISPGKYLDLNYTNLKYLDLSANNELISPNIKYNDSLVSIDYRNKINPGTIDIHDNPQLTSLDLRNIPTINIESSSDFLHVSTLDIYKQLDIK